MQASVEEEVVPLSRGDLRDPAFLLPPPTQHRKIGDRLTSLS